MTFVVYAIQSTNGRIYIGQTENLQRRLEQHNKGQVKSTKKDRPWAVVKIEDFPTREKARFFEYQLKKSRGRRLTWLES
jgi:putative endonuclease